jgi:1-deoxy-D-xylulose-5-phosphate synthase
MVTPAMTVGEALAATVVNMRFVKPLDTDLILELARSHTGLVTVEENALPGGAGSAVNLLLQSQRLLLPVLNIGLPDAFIEQGTREELLAFCGLDAASIQRRIEEFFA